MKPTLITIVALLLIGLAVMFAMQTADRREHERQQAAIRIELEKVAAKARADQAERDKIKADDEVLKSDLHDASAAADRMDKARF